MAADSSCDEKFDLCSPASFAPTSTTAGSNPCGDVENAGEEERRGPALSPAGRLAQCVHWARKKCHRNVEEGEDIHERITRSLDEAPRGYSKLAVFQSSDPCFLQYRGFSYLHSRLLLSQQYDIERLEAELDRIDRWEESKDDPMSRLVSRAKDDKYPDPAGFGASFAEADCTRSRPQVFTELRRKLVEYDEVLLKTKEVAALPRPSKRDYNSSKAFFINYEPIVEEEARFVRCREDLVTLRSGREAAGFEGLVERVLTKLDRCLSKLGVNVIQKMFLTPELRAKTKDRDVRYFSPQRVDAMIGILITLIIFVMLVVPVFAMYALSDLGTRASAFEAISLLILFTLLFGFAMSLLTKAKRHELFAACAAYCGVLVVFIGNFSTQSVVIQQ